jgi:hypothetical protein
LRRAPEGDCRRRSGETLCACAESGAWPSVGAVRRLSDVKQACAGGLTRKKFRERRAMDLLSACPLLPGGCCAKGNLTTI